MLKILHTSDLHINNDDKEYCLDVLSEIVDYAQNNQINYLLICGDMFDSYKNFSNPQLLNDVRKIFSKLTSCKVLYIAGNHEILGKKQTERLSAFNLSPVDIICDAVEVIEDEARFICIPFSRDYSSLVNANTDNPGKPVILLMHGTHSKIYRGPDAHEADDEIIPDVIFDMFKPDYAALGGIHANSEMKSGKTILSYCGSPRVWRSGETGARQMIYFEVKDGKLSDRKLINIQRAGEFKEITIPVNTDSGMDAFAKKLNDLLTQSQKDYLRFNISGVVTDENVLNKNVEQLKKEVEHKVRKYEIITSNVLTMSSLADNKLAGEFLKRMDMIKPAAEGEGMNIWLEARIMGLEKINGYIK